MLGFDFIYRVTLGQLIKCPVLTGEDFGEYVALTAAKAVTWLRPVAIRNSIMMVNSTTYTEKNPHTASR